MPKPATFNGMRMSDRYCEAIDNAEAEIGIRLPPQKLVIHEADRCQGVDALPEPWHQIALDVAKYSLEELDYELSYNQLCIAFFRAVELSNLLEVQA